MMGKRKPIRSSKKYKDGYMENNVLVISNLEELEQYFSNLCRDISQVTDQVLDFGDYSQAPLVIKEKSLLLSPRHG